MGRNKIDLAGKRIGTLTVLRYSRTEKRNAYWNTVCDCGNTKEFTGSALAKGKVKSCGKGSCDPSRRGTAASNGVKKCPKCREARPTKCFGTTSRGTDGFRSWCKLCERTYQRKRCTDPETRAYTMWSHRRRGSTPEKIHKTARIMVEGYCQATGVKFDLSTREGRKWNGPSIDQIVPGGGYDDGNWHITTNAYNFAKNSWGEEPILATADGIRSRRYFQANPSSRVVYDMVGA